MSDADLVASSLNVVEAIKKGYPDLSDKEVARLGEVLLKELANRIENGEKLAFVQPTDNGSIILTILDLAINQKDG